MSTYLDERAKVGDQLSFTGPNGSFFLRGAGPGIAAGGRHPGWPRSCRNSARCVPTASSTVAPHLRRQHRRGRRSSWARWRASPPNWARPDLGLLRRGQGQLGGAQGFRHRPHRARASLRGRRFGLSVWSAADGRGGSQAPRGRGCGAVGFDDERFALSGTAASPAKAPAEPEVLAKPETLAVAVTPAAERPQAVAAILTGPDGRAVAGQIVLPSREIPPLVGVAVAASPSDEAATARAIAGQQVARAGSDVAVTPLDPDGDIIESSEARSVAGQQVLVRADIAPLVEPQYVIGEEHPSVLKSDAIFDAREALELGALELTIGRMTSRQLTGYRLLAESTVPYVEGDRFVDAAAFTETNAAFHDYLLEHDPQRASAAGLQQPRRQGPHARGAAPRHLVRSAVSQRTISILCRRLRPVTGTPRDG